MIEFEVGDYTFTVITSSTVKIGAIDTSRKHNAVKAENCPSKIIIPSTVTNGATYTVTTAGSYSFYECRNVDSIEIPETITIIENNAFDRIYITSEVKLPSKLEYIGSFSFAANEFTSVKVPASVKSMGDSPFSFNKYLTSIIVEGGKYFVSLNDSVMMDIRKERIICVVVSITELVLPETVKMIDSRSMTYCKIKTLVLNTKLSVLNFQAISCQFVNIYIYGNIRSIDQKAFGSNNLENIYYFGSRSVNTVLSVPTTVVYHACRGYKGDKLFGSSFTIEYCYANSIKPRTCCYSRVISCSIPFIIYLISY